MSKMGEEYNKRLEKYAPELLEACKQASLYHSVLIIRASEDKKIKDEMGVGWNDICDMLIQAIAKVEKL